MNDPSKFLVHKTAMRLESRAHNKVLVNKERMSLVQSRKKSYADNRRRPMEFKVGDRVFLKISAMRGVM
jgi:hypothetical protein